MKKQSTTKELFAVNTDRELMLVRASSYEAVIDYVREEYGRSMMVEKVTQDPDDIAWAKAWNAVEHEAD